MDFIYELTGLVYGNKSGFSGDHIESFIRGMVETKE